MHSNRFEMAHRESCVPTAPKRSRSKHSAFDSQRLYIQALTNSFALSLSHPQSASVSPTGSHTSKELHIYIKTMGFKPLGITYLREAFSQTLLNHILPKIGVGGGVPLYVRASVPHHRSVITTEHQSAFTRKLPHMTPGAIIQFHTPPHSRVRCVWGAL